MWNTVTHDSIVENIGNSFQIGNTGHSYLISGETSVGKTTLALHIIAEAQKLGGYVVFIDAEHAMDPT